MAVVVLLLGMILCLAGNIVGMELAIMQNDQACQRVLYSVSRVLSAGITDKTSLELAAQGALDGCGPETFMTATPRCNFITEEEVGGKHLLKVGTSILAKVPAPILVFSTGHGNKLEFHRTYIWDETPISESTEEQDKDSH